MTEQTVLALITCQTYPEPSDNLKTLAACLESMGVKTVFDAWQNHPSAPFLLPLCAWDYAAEPEAFRQWLEQAEQAGQRFINPPELMAWNMEKTYLCDLVARGTQVIPSVFVPPQKAVLADILNQQGWTEAVIKPAFGQSGKGVVKVCAEELDVNMADYPQGMIVQPYIREIETVGETSLVFFNGIFSHAVRRQPPQGEWRANSAYGVSVFGIEPPEFAISAAQDVLAA
ncbi:ATP-grasp domain-containing protein, partial [Neisseria sp. P0006.S006]